MRELPRSGLGQMEQCITDGEVYQSPDHIGHRTGLAGKGGHMGLPADPLNKMRDSVETEHCGKEKTNQFQHDCFLLSEYLYDPSVVPVDSKRD